MIAILFHTHIISAEILKRYDAIDLPGDRFCKMLAIDVDRCPNAAVAARPLFTYSVKVIKDAGYHLLKHDTLLPGSNHLPAISYLVDHPDISDAWVVEYDVVFSGAWSTLFGAIPEGTDFVTTKLRSQNSDPDWHWWQTFNNCSTANDRTPVDRLYASFNPLYRLSHRAAV